MSIPSRGQVQEHHLLSTRDPQTGVIFKRGGDVSAQRISGDRASSLDSDVRDMAVAALTNDFLTVSDLSLDLRAYLVETTLPTAVLALEKLIKEVERRRLLEDGAKLTPAGGVALAAEDTTLEPQPDKPLETTFNPINWLAQYLYRNNPRYSNFTEPLVAPYIASMNQIGDHLKARLFELHTNRRARLHAEELARKREDERMLKALQLKQEEKRNMFTELLATVFKKWSSKNWRMAPGFLLKAEIIEALRAILHADSIQSDDSLINKSSFLLNAFSLSPEVSEKARTSHEEQQKVEGAGKTGLWRGATPGSRPISRGGLFGPKGYVPAEFLAMQMWTQEMFVESMLFVMDSAEPEWTQEEMGVFLQVLSTHVDERADRLLEEFNQNLVVPKFSKLGQEIGKTGSSAFSTSAPNTPAAGSQSKDAPLQEFSPAWAEAIREDWKRRLGRLVEGLMNGEEVDPDLDVAEIKASMLDYSHGLVRVDPGTPSTLGVTRAGTAAVVSWRAGSVSGSVLGQQSALSTPDYRGASSQGRPEASSAFEATSGILPAFVSGTADSEAVASRYNKPESVITLAGVTNEVEEEYKTYLRVMIGLQGIRPFNVLMSYMRRMVMEQDAYLDGSSPAAQGEVLTVADRENALLDAFALFIGISKPVAKGVKDDSFEEQEESQDLIAFRERVLAAVADVLQLQTTIDMILDRGGRDLDARLRTVLESLRKLDEAIVSRRVVTGKEFVELALKGCEALNDPGFRELEGILRKEFQEAAVTFSALMQQQTPGEAPADEASSAKINKELDRERIERRALSEIARLAKRPSISIREAADESLHALTSALTALHPAHVVRGRLAVADHGQDAAASATSTTSPLSSPGGAVDRFFKFLACSPDIKEGYLNTTLSIDGEEVEAKVLRSSKLLRIETGEDNEVVRKVEAGTPVSPNSISKFLGVPMLSPVGPAPRLVGMIGLTLSGDEDGGFVDPDVKFVETASSAILETMDKVDRRLKAIALAESSLKYARELGDGEVNIYLNEPESWNDPPKFFKVESFSPNAPFIVEVEEGGKATDRPKSPKVCPMAEDNPITDILVQTATEMDLIDYPDPDGRITTYIPVIDAEKHVVAVMTVRPLPGKTGEMNPEDLDDVRRVTSVLASALNQIEKERFGEKDEFALEGEWIDEDSRRGLLFSKMMLLNARELLGKLDNRALAELRSYKKPPAIIHKVLKAVLYVFGRLPKELQNWAETVKLINADLLKTMINYDPTAIQKKIRFKRCNRVLKRA
ncbi:EF-hand calcium-binding domain-containing protein 5 [Dinochytrium kinnereticum]|nr:EF-hand calcium-binding domain-containing protein 5 [Dinochytrium kinnereticum]